ncbi:DUF4142 domain-containing protein [Nocardia stercoris]|uniref:DUF4142 domain-containing protein n=2 Tax=Nocardia stercoris TaxID=2483361 RepID=A0A3M2L129_9NOCA|nr:DUF4142 domain-containing protein [Nocardia stercoris]
MLAAVALGTVIAGPAAASPAAGSPDQDYLVALDQGNLAELVAATRGEATHQGVCPDIPAMSPELFDDHSAAERDTTTVAASKVLVLPAAPGQSQIDQELATGTKTGTDFDHAWITMELGFHTDALAATQREIATGTDQAVVALAAKLEPVIRHHIEMVEAAAPNCSA